MDPCRSGSISPHPTSDALESGSVATLPSSDTLVFVSVGHLAGLSGPGLPPFALLQTVAWTHHPNTSANE
jgi:hypothetical protein